MPGQHPRNRDRWAQDITEDREAKDLREQSGRKDLSRDQGTRDVVNDLGRRDLDQLGAKPISLPLLPSTTAISGGILHASTLRKVRRTRSRRRSAK